MSDCLASTTLVCKKIKKIAESLSSDDPSKDTEALRAKGYRLFLELKQLNRDVMFMGMEGKKEVQIKKREQDQINLQLQGLQYEKSHFIKEINKCKDFQWQSKKVDVVSKEEFLAEVGAGMQDADEHTLQLARLAHELKARRKLLVTVADLKAEKEQLLKANAEKRKFLEGLSDRIGLLFKDASAIQSMLPLSSESITCGEAAPYLPQPLYNLYNVVMCYKRYYDESIAVRIEGDLEQARTAAAADATAAVVAQPATKRQKTGTDSEVKMSDGGDNFSTHPLSVLIVSDAASALGAVHLCFRFHPTLDVVTVSMTDEKDRKSHSSLLLNLYPDDCGEELPNNIGHLLRQDESAFKIDPQHGIPFRWAQGLCGLRFDHPRVRRRPQYDLASVLARIERRVLMRQSLAKQYACLQKKTFPIPVVSDEFPHKPKAVMSRWTRVDTDKFARACGGKGEEWWTRGAEHFQITFSRGSVVLEAWVEVTVEYPLRPPRFKLFLPKGLPDITSTSAAASGGALVKATANAEVLAQVASGERGNMFVNDLNDIEIEVNNHFPCPLSEFADQEASFQLSKSTDEAACSQYLLSYQLRKLQTCLDLLVEARKNQSVRFLEALRGPDRRKPFVFGSHSLYYARS